MFDNVLKSILNWLGDKNECIPVDKRKTIDIDAFGSLKEIQEKAMLVKTN